MDLNTDIIESVIEKIGVKITDAVSYTRPSKIYVELAQETK